MVEWSHWKEEVHFICKHSDSREFRPAAGRADMMPLRCSNGWISAQELWISRFEIIQREWREIIGAEIAQWKLTLIGQK